MIIDGTDAVLGRLATEVVKTLKKGEEVTVVNAKDIIIIGNKESIFKRYRNLRDIGNPLKGPFFPRSPERIVRRSIRGMINYKTNKGREALRRLKVFNQIPEGLKGDFKQVQKKQINTNFVRTEEISKHIGWNNG